MLPSSFASISAQATNTAADASASATASQAPPPFWTSWVPLLFIFAMIYFAFIRPQTQAKKQQEEKMRAAKTGDRIITTSGIHGMITNVKDTTVIVKIADNVKIEVEKSHIDKVTRESDPEKSDKSDKPATATKA